MIRYALKCPEGHSFESWFQSAGAYDSLRAAGHLSCPDCGSDKVEKALMAPDVRPGRKAAARPAPEAPAEAAAAPAPGAAARPAPGPLSAPRSELERALAALRRKVESESEYVGPRFAKEARAMQAGEAPERPIYGEARIEEARALIEEGVRVAPLPFRPARKTN